MTQSPTTKVVPVGPTVEQLKKDVRECEQGANHTPEPLATRLREKAELLREWMKLRRRAWKS